MMDYGLGYRARLAGMLLVVEAPSAWRSGWDDADTDRIELIRHQKIVAEGLEDGYEASWGVLFDAGCEARVHGIAFEEGRTRPWQAGWIKADIRLGFPGVER